MTFYNARGVAMAESAAEAARVVGTSAGGETINAPAGNSSLSGEGGGDMLVGNSLDNRHWITDPKDVVVEQPGGGIDTEIGWTSIRLAANVENLQVNGAFNYAYGNDQANLIVVDDNSHWVYGAGGDDVLVGGPTAKTTFVVRAGEGSDVIYNWQGNDQVQLLNYGFTSAEQVKAAMSQDGADVMLRLSDSESLTFRGVTLGSFADRQFLLPLDASKLGALTFSDDFDTLKTYDPSTQTGVWSTDFGGNLKDPWAYTLTSNGERQVYTKPGFYGQGEQDLGFNPLSVSNGVLTITAERIPDELRDGAWGREYSSGMINTLGSFEQQYGYFEMKAQLPSAVGTWPAFWLMPTPYTAQTEADIMEGLAATPNVDYRRAWGGGDNLYDNTLKIDPTGFHTYGMLWTPQTVTFYYDGYAVLQAATPANWTQPMGMIVNMAVGGWGGEPNSLQFPAEMKIDYIHVYNLADNSAVIETGTPETPVATLRVDGEATSGQVAQALTFDQDGSALGAAHIAIYGAKPTDLPPGKTFVVWEDSGAVFGAISDGHTLGTATPLMAGRSDVFTGAGAWLTDGKVALGYMAPAETGQSAWVMIFDPSKNSFTRHQLGDSTGDIDVVATKNGNFAASWDAPDGTTHARAYDGFAYDGRGWFGPERQVTGDLTGYAQNGDLIATSGSGQQLYSVNNPAPSVNAMVSIGPMDGVTHVEGDSGTTAFTFTLTRDFDLSQKTTVGWTVRGQGAHPADAQDFAGGALPSGVATFEINQASTTITVLVQGDTTVETDEQFLVTLVNPVGAKLGQATATGFVQTDADDGSTPAPAPPPVIGFATSSVSLAEGDSGLAAFSFTVTRSGAVAEGSTVNWSLAGSGANPATANDFIGNALPGGTLTFAPGETSQVVTVTVAGDSAVEGDEAFTLTLSGPTGATLGTATASGLITNDDTAATPPPSGSGEVYNSPGPGSTVTAGAGDDTLNASQGSDVLTGGAGADTFAWAKAPWSPATVTDFTLGADTLDLSKLFQTAGYTGADPVADKVIWLLDDGAGGTKVLFDRDGTASGQQWPDYILKLDGVATAVLTWAKLSGSDGAVTPPADPPPSDPPPGSGGPGQVYNSPGPNSTVTAGAGDDTLNASQGADVLTGGAGADTFSWGKAPWAPATVTDFTVGQDRLDLSALFQQAGYTGSDPVADKVIWLLDDGAGSTKLLFDRDGTGSGQQWPDYIITLNGVPASGLTWSQLAGSTPSAPPPTPAAPGTMVVFAGQSNTGGYGTDANNAPTAWRADPLTLIWNDTSHAWEQLNPGANSGYPGNPGGWGPELQFAIDFRQQHPDEVLRIVKFAEGGTALAQDTTQYAGDWSPNSQGEHFDHVTQIVANASASLGGLKPAMVFWGQGEEDASHASEAQAYGANLTQLFAAIRDQWMHDAKGDIGFFMVGTSAPYSTDVRTAEASVDQADPDATSFDTAGFPMQGDSVHYAPAGYVQVGDHYFQLYEAARTAAPPGDPPPSDPPPSSGSGQVINSAAYGDTLTGGAGADTLNAGQGPDQLTGGAGADVFAYRNGVWNAGHVTDFTPGVDKLDLSGLFAQSNYHGTDPLADHRLEFRPDGAGNTQVYVDLDGAGGDWPMMVTTLDHVTPAQIGSSDWIVG